MVHITPIFDIVCILFFIFLLCITLIHTAQEVSGNAPFIPISRNMRREIILILKLDSKSICYDLGSGDGRVACSLGNAYPEARIIGVERSYLPYIISRFNQWRMHARNVTFLRQSFFDRDLSNATHLFLYLYPAVMGDLKTKFERELSPGTKVVSCDFTFPGKESQAVYDFSKTHRSKYKLYVYEF